MLEAILVLVVFIFAFCWISFLLLNVFIVIFGDNHKSGNPQGGMGKIRRGDV